MESKYLKYKIKYHQLKNQLKNQNNQHNQHNQHGGSCSINNQHGGHDNKKDTEAFYFTENNINEKKPTFYLFKASWCGHCKAFRETWNALADKYKDKINFISYDSDKDKKEMKSWRIGGFPSMIYRSGTKAIEYAGDRDINSLITFIKNQSN